METLEETHTLALQKLIFGAHLNAASCLFGGHLLSWIDEASAMFAMDKMQTRKILTKKISEVIFINPALLGDMIQFWCRVSKEGKSSLTIELTVKTKNVDTRQQRDICSCEIVYVAVDDLGKPYPWRHV
jgi:acyl-CoA hydrolase